MDNQKQLRRNLRQQNVVSEKILWNKLRNRSFFGLKFRRQHSIDRFIVDFYCAELMLVIEIDGATHETEQEVARDNERQKYIENLGFAVKRYTNTDVKENIEGVLEDLHDYCLLKKPHPGPLLERRGDEGGGC